MQTVIDLLNRLITFLVAGTTAFKTAQATIDHFASLAKNLWEEIKGNETLIAALSAKVGVLMEVNRRLEKQIVTAADTMDEIEKLAATGDPLDMEKIRELAARPFV